MTKEEKTKQLEAYADLLQTADADLDDIENTLGHVIRNVKTVNAGLLIFINELEKET